MDEGAVPRETVLLVLKANGVLISESIEGGKHKTTMSTDTRAEVQFFPEMVPRRIVLHLANKFKVPRHYFWHPDMMPEQHQVPGLRPN